MTIGHPNNDAPKTWTCDLFCPSCRKPVTAQVLLGVGIAVYLETRRPCPECGTPGLWLTADCEALRPPAATDKGA